MKPLLVCWSLLSGVVLLVASSAFAASTNCFKYYECYDYEEAPVEAWKEEEAKPPAPPVESKLIAFEVNVTNPNRFFVDPASISVGKDGVVRYTAVIESPSGARTVNYEGLRCDTRERRLYAFGQRDGSWTENKNGPWMPMPKAQDSLRNAYYATLAGEYFCIDQKIVPSAEEAIDRLRRGSSEVWERGDRFRQTREQ